MSKSQEEWAEQQRKDQYHAANLQGENRNGEAAQVLRTLSHIEDLPIQPKDDPVMGQLVSELTSTANLTSEEVRSNEWVREYILILYISQFPTEDGMHSQWREWAHNDDGAGLEPLDPRKRTMLETLVTSSKLALSRSEDAKVIEEGTRDVSESVITESESESGGNGILGKIGLG